MGSPTPITDGERIVGVERVTNSLRVMDHEHTEIHEGASYRVDASDAVSANEAHTVSFKTADSTKQVNMEWSISSENSSNVTVYENSEVTNGDAITPRNANRQFPDASTMQAMVEDADIVTTNAAILGHHIIGSSGSKPSDESIGGSSTSRREWILKRNTWYTVEVIDTSVSTQTLWIGLDWYEHAPETS